MRKAEIIEGADLYYAAGDPWRILTPIRVTVVDARPHRIVRGKAGPVELKEWTPDPAGNAFVVDVHGPTTVRRDCVPSRHLRGLWLPTLAAQGRTVAGVKARQAWVHELTASGHEVTAGGLLRVAAADTELPGGVLVALADADQG